MNFFKKLNYSLLRDPEEEIIEYDVSNCSICYLKNEFKPVWVGWNRESKRLLCIDCFNNFNFLDSGASNLSGEKFLAAALIFLSAVFVRTTRPSKSGLLA